MKLYFHNDYIQEIICTLFLFCYVLGEWWEIQVKSLTLQSLESRGESTQKLNYYRNRCMLMANTASYQLVAISPIADERTWICSGWQNTQLYSSLPEIYFVYSLAFGVVICWILFNEVKGVACWELYGKYSYLYYKEKNSTQPSTCFLSLPWECKSIWGQVARTILLHWADTGRIKGITEMLNQ